MANPVRRKPALIRRRDPKDAATTTTNAVAGTIAGERPDADDDADDPVFEIILERNTLH